jgi:hypothetical protein
MKPTNHLAQHICSHRASRTGSSMRHMESGFSPHDRAPSWLARSGGTVRAAALGNALADKAFLVTVVARLGSGGRGEHGEQDGVVLVHQLSL